LVRLSAIGVTLAGQFLKPISGYAGIAEVGLASSLHYDSLQVSARRRLAQHFQFGAAWTWSRVLDFNDSGTEQVTTFVPVRHTLSRGVLNGWQLSGITRFVSGQPLSVDFTTAGGTDFTGSGSISVRIQVLGNPVLPKNERSLSRNFRTDVFTLPAVGTGHYPHPRLRHQQVRHGHVQELLHERIHRRAQPQAPAVGPPPGLLNSGAASAVGVYACTAKDVTSRPCSMDACRPNPHGASTH
jgi:hypothetical protein